MGVFGFLKNLGPGGLSDDAIKDAIMEETDDFDSTIKRGMSGLILDFVTPWFRHCVKKYTEEEFHLKMAYGFSFIKDWETNHANTFARIISGSRRVRRFLNWNNDEFVDKMTDLSVSLLAERGWQVYDSERAALRETFIEMRRRIYTS